MISIKVLPWILVGEGLLLANARRNLLELMEVLSRTEKPPVLPISRSTSVDRLNRLLYTRKLPAPGLLLMPCRQSSNVEYQTYKSSALKLPMRIPAWEFRINFERMTVVSAKPLSRAPPLIPYPTSLNTS